MHCLWNALYLALAGYPHSLSSIPFSLSPPAFEKLNADALRVLTERDDVAGWRDAEPDGKWEAEIRNLRGDASYVGCLVIRALAVAHNRFIAALHPDGRAYLYPPVASWVLRSEGGGAGACSLSFPFPTIVAFEDWLGGGAVDKCPPRGGAAEPLILLHNGMQGLGAHFESVQPVQPAPPSPDSDADVHEEEEEVVVVEEEEEEEPSQSPPPRWDDPPPFVPHSREVIDALRRELNAMGAKVSVADSLRPSFFHQAHAVKAIVNDLTRADAPETRVQFQMATGSGKTAVLRWAMDVLRHAHKVQREAAVAATSADSHNTMVAAPSLGLLRQLFIDFVARGGPLTDADVDVIIFCSEDLFGSEDEGTPRCRVTNDEADVESFLRRPGNKLLMTTYASVPRVKTVAKKLGGFRFDLVLLDEAHRTAVKKGFGTYTTALDDINIMAEKRVCATATRRLLFLPASGRQPWRLLTMSDPTYFGKCVAAHPHAHPLVALRCSPLQLFSRFSYRLDLRPAIYERIITDYRVLVVMTDEGGAASEAHAQRDALRQATASMRRDGVYHPKLITFHDTNKPAAALTQVLQKEGIEGVSNLVSRHLFAEYRDESQSARERASSLKLLEQHNGTVALNTCRSVEEGVDVPACNGVCLFGHLRYPTRLMQIAGRALRVPRDTTVVKKCAYIVVLADRATALDPFAGLSGAVAVASPPPRAAPASRKRAPSSAQPACRPPKRARRRAACADGKRDAEEEAEEEADNEVESCDGDGAGGVLHSAEEEEEEEDSEADKPPSTPASALPASSAAAVLSALIETDAMLKHAVRCAAESGDSGALAWLNAHVCVLGGGGGSAAGAIDALSLLRACLPDAPPLHEYAFSENCAMLERRVAEGKNPNVKAREVKLWKWLYDERTKKEKGKLPPAHLARLSAIKGLRHFNVIVKEASWRVPPPVQPARRTSWEVQIGALKAYAKDNGNYNVPRNHVCSLGTRLGTWLDNKRLAFRENRIIPAQLKELRTFPGLTGFSEDDLSPSELWEHRYQELIAYVEKYGNPNVKFRYGPLGVWLSTQRKAYRGKKGHKPLTADRLAKLRAISGLDGFR